jgi:hypothetical protein
MNIVHIDFENSNIMNMLNLIKITYNNDIKISKNIYVHTFN